MEYAPIILAKSEDSKDQSACKVSFDGVLDERMEVTGSKSLPVFTDEPLKNGRVSKRLLASYCSLVSRASAGSAFSLVGVGSVGSVCSVLAVLCLAGAASLLSIGSTASVLSLASTASVLSVASTASFLSYRSHGCTLGYGENCIDKRATRSVEHLWEIRYTSSQWSNASQCTLAMKQSDIDYEVCDYIQISSCQIDDTVDTNCKVKRKGSGTWRDLESKPSFKIKLDDQYEVGTFNCSGSVCPPGAHGNVWHTEKFTLNNQVMWDGEIDAYDVYRSLTPASLAVQVAVALYKDDVLQSNQTYAMVENVNDEEFANKWFGNDWRLYETEKGVTKFERAGGVFKDSPTNWPEIDTTELTLADVDQSNMVRYYAAARRTNDWDGACGPYVNNHYLLHNGAAWHHIPWGLDRTFDCKDHYEFKSCNAVNECLETNACRGEHEAVVREIEANDDFRKANCPDTLTIVLLNVLIPPIVALLIVGAVSAWKNCVSETDASDTSDASCKGERP